MANVVMRRILYSVVVMVLVLIRIAFMMIGIFQLRHGWRFTVACDHLPCKTRRRKGADQHDKQQSQGGCEYFVHDCVRILIYSRCQRHRFNSAGAILGFAEKITN